MHSERFTSSAKRSLSANEPMEVKTDSMKGDREMDKAEYEMVRERIRTICTKSDERRTSEYNDLMMRVFCECTPAQKGGITRIVRQRNSDADYADMYHSQF